MVNGVLLAGPQWRGPVMDHEESPWTITPDPLKLMWEKREDQVFTPPHTLGDSASNRDAGWSSHTGPAGHMTLSPIACNRFKIGWLQAPISNSYTTPAEPVTIGSLTYSRGSVTWPVRALAATVNGDAR